MRQSRTETLVLGGGCFWCIEAVFKRIKGVVSVESGYAGGATTNPTYQDVCEGDTGHAEVVKVVYDPYALSLRDLFTVFFGSHDPTTLNRQGNDVGTQYRSIILYTTDAQRVAAEAYKRDIPDAVTEIQPLDVFYPAEPLHQDYAARNPHAAYCSLVINPKLEHIQERYAALLSQTTTP